MENETKNKTEWEWSKKWIAAMYVISGVFLLQLIGKPLDPLTSGSLFTFLAAYVVGQSFVDGKKKEKGVV